MSFIGFVIFAITNQPKMADKNLLSICDSIASLVGENRLYDAYSMLISLCESKMWWELSQQAKAQQESYRYMLEYAAKGVDDPERPKLYARLKDDVLTMADKLRRRIEIDDTPTIYYNTLRYEGRQGGDSVRSLLDSLRSKYNDRSLLNVLADGDSASNASAKDIEALEKRIFDRIWVTFPIKGDTYDAIASTLSDNDVPYSLKRIIVGALLMGQLQNHDMRRLELLLELYRTATSGALAITALTAALIGMAAHPDRLGADSLLDRIAALRDTTAFSTDVRNVYIELRRSLDTDRLTNKLRNEVIPQIMKLRPDIAKKINQSEGLDLGSLEENPEWAEMWEKSGVGDKLREISELHEQGADVMMGAFSRLKSYPFFNDVVNWFRAFDADNSHLSHLADTRDLIDLLDMGQGLCDSDKYSLALSLATLPEAQKRLMASQLAAQADQIARVKLASLTIPADDRRRDAAEYVHDLYRFFKLYRRKGDFDDPFSGDFDLCDIEALRPDVDHVETLMLLVNLGLKGQHWNSTLKLLARLHALQPNSVQTLQQIGYCYQQLDNYTKAIDWYGQAELLDGDNRWTVRRLAAAHRMAGDPAGALRYYRKLEAGMPDDLKLAMNIGYCHLELGEYPEAATYFYKVDYLDDKSHKAVRPLAWSLLLSRKFDRAQTYYERILTLDPTPDDYLNMGHLALACRKMAEALNFYRMYIDLKGGDTSHLADSLATDADALATMGVDPGLVPLIYDYIKYSQISNN